MMRVNFLVRGNADPSRGRLGQDARAFHDGLDGDVAIVGCNFCPGDEARCWAVDFLVLHGDCGGVGGREKVFV